MKRIYAVVICVLCWAVSGWAACGRAVSFSALSGEVTSQHRVSGDTPAGRAFKNKASHVQVEDEGVVIRILPDDLTGDRHQRFIISLASGQTVLIAHNIDIAPRVAELKKEDRVRFYGEYVWNEKGGLVHWTHHDPKGHHVAGWIKHGEKTYQ